MDPKNEGPKNKEILKIRKAFLKKKILSLDENIVLN